MTPSESARLISRLKSAYPRQDVSADTLKIYCEMLVDFELSEAEAATRKIIATSRFFPTIAEIRSVVVEMRIGPQSAEEAWAEVKSAIRHIGAHRSPEFSGDIVTRAVDAIGWQTLCASESIGVERAHFLRIYESMRAQQLGEANTAPILAKHSQQAQLPMPREERLACRDEGDE